LKKNVLIIGKESKIGSSLILHINSDLYSIFSTTRRRHNVTENTYYLNLENIDEFLELNLSFEIIVFCSAISNNKICNQNPELAYDVNYANTIRLVKFFSIKQSYIIIFSTSQVVENFKYNTEFYMEKQPNTIYGKTKYLLEQHLNLLNEKICVIRSTKVIDKKNELFQKWILDLKNKNEISPLKDIYFAPISISFMIDLIIKCLLNEYVGLIEVSAKSEITYSYAAFYIAKKLNLDQKLINPIFYRNTNLEYVPSNSILISNVENCKMNPPIPEEALDFFVNNYEI
jgi:dTDP-4-dehydrorhamnose reductase